MPEDGACRHFMGSPTRIGLLTLIPVLAVLMGCGRKAATSEDDPPSSTSAVRELDHIWPSSDAVAADRLEWSRRTLVNAYNEVGLRDPAWDQTAREALETFARMRVGTDSNAPAQFKKLVEATLAAGCNDPLFRYLALRNSHGGAQEANAAAADAYREAGDNLMNSGYPEIRKFYGAIRAAQAWKSAHGSDTNSAEILTHFRRGAFHRLQNVLLDPDTPFMEAYEAAQELQQTIHSNPGQEPDMLPSLISYFQTRWPDDPRGMTLCGQAYVRLAWNRRGSGYAPSVSNDGWKEFASYLAEADRCLERSWALSPTNTATAIAMMEVELGQGRGRQWMELWFDRAMALDPACYDAANSMAWYLQPKWHGSAAAAIAFGRECVENEAWKGRVPLVLWRAHQMLANDRASGLKDAYWTRPGVWEDVRDSFERFFELNPDAFGWHHDYALHAYKCGQMDKFLDLLPQMRWVNHPYFGGEARFVEMVARAEKETGRKAALPK